jgi:hypothetical protein
LRIRLNQGRRNGDEHGGAAEERKLRREPRRARAA